MTTLENGNRKISVKFGAMSSETKTITTKETDYIVTLPTIHCNNEQDATQILSAVDNFVSDLVKNILKDKE